MRNSFIHNIASLRGNNEFRYFTNGGKTPLLSEEFCVKDHSNGIRESIVGIANAMRDVCLPNEHKVQAVATFDALPFPRLEMF